MFALKTHQGTVAIQQQNLGTASQLAELQQLQRQLQVRLERHPAHKVESMPEALASTVQAIANAARAQDIHVAEANLQNATAANEMLVSGVSKPVSGVTRLKRASYMVKGEYRDLPSFERFLKTIEQMPASIDRLRIQGRKFDTTISIYGE